MFLSAVVMALESTGVGSESVGGGGGGWQGRGGGVRRGERGGTGQVLSREGCYSLVMGRCLGSPET